MHTLDESRLDEEYDRGYEEGLKEGHEAGYDKGFNDGLDLVESETTELLAATKATALKEGFAAGVAWARENGQ